MKRLLSGLILFFLLSPCAWATWTDKYVTADAAGGGDGSLATPWTLAEAIAAVAAGERINVKAGVYANTTSTLTFATPGTTTAPIWWRGYKSTIGDQDGAGGVRVAGTDIPSITFGNAQFVVSGAYQTFSNLDISGQAQASAQVDLTGGHITLLRCRASNTATAGALDYTVRAATVSPVFLLACYFSAETTNVFAVVYDGIGAVFVHGCYIAGGHTYGMRMAAAGSHISGSVITGSAGIGLDMEAGNLSVTNCTVTGNSGDGIRFTIAACNSLVANTIVSSNGTSGTVYGINQSSGGNSDSLRLMADDFFGNRTANLNGLQEQADYTADLPTAMFSIAETASPFISASNFALQYNAKAIGAGFPGILENTTVTGHRSIGAVEMPLDGWKVISENHRGFGILFAGIGLLGLGIIPFALRLR